MKTSTLNSLKTLVVLVALCIVGGFGTCTAGIIGLHYFGPKPIELSRDITINELIKKCGPMETQGMNHASWERPSCITKGQHMEVIFNLRTKRLMEWKVVFKNENVEERKIKLKLTPKTSLTELKKRCGEPVEERTDYAKWEHPNCEVVKQLEVAFEPESRLALEGRRVSVHNKTSIVRLGVSKEWIF